MKIPVGLSTAIVLLGMVLTWWMKAHVGVLDRYMELVISTWATVGALVSATFVIYGYLLSLRALVESQMPRILLQVTNGQATLVDNNQLVHQTHINYRNIGTVECVDLAMYAVLVRNNEYIEIPRLFNGVMNLQVGDMRDRKFPTFNYMCSNGIPQSVVDNLQHYKLRVGYKVKSVSGIVERAYYYTWDNKINSWHIE
ncbi:hypothetical protein [Citrobacter koseri]|uniref:hypothetical protein n=1 Tax=Citrobacter koseri TaxID=545 RepID=UPI00389238E8